MALPPDPDTIRYPSSDTKLILSVSDKIEPLVGIKDNLAMYVERFSLASNLETQNTTDDSPVQFGLFTSKFSSPKLSKDLLNLSIPGLNGSSNEVRNGCRGGILEVYIENMTLDTAKRLQLTANGGAGFNPSKSKGNSFVRPGGDGGSGGRVTVLLGTEFNQEINRVGLMLDHLDDSKKTWPEAFKDDATEVFNMVSQEQVKGIWEVPESWHNAEGVLGTSRSMFRRRLRFLSDALMTPEKKLHNQLVSVINVSGGPYGRGTRVDSQQGKSGEAGKPGKREVEFTAYSKRVWDLKTCFVHPVQCGMLLSKAKTLLFAGTDKARAQAVSILGSLTRRLQFLTGTTAESIGTSNLAQAYRASEQRLFIISNTEAKEPVSISQLRSVLEEAQSTLDHLKLGGNYYGHQQGEVPRGSFKFYEENAKEALKHLRAVETMYAKYIQAAEDMEKRKQAIQGRTDQLMSSRDLKQQLQRDAVQDLETAARNIKLSSDLVPPAKDELLKVVRDLEGPIKESFGMTLEDVIGVFSKLIFVDHSPTTMLQEGANLLRTGIEKVKDNGGTPVKKEYVIRQIYTIKNIVESMKEGYQALKDGSLKLDDPDASKLLAVKGDLDEILAKFSKALGAKNLENAKKKLDTYVESVLKRNEAVLRYNSDIALIVKYQTELDTLVQQRADLTRIDYDTVGVDRPAMTEFIKKLYETSIETSQSWLYKAQRAYNFVAINQENIIGDTMEGVPVSQYDYSLLNSVQNSLTKRYNNHKEAMGSNPQKLGATKYYMDSEHVARLREKKNGDIMLEVDIPADPTARQRASFAGMADVRLTRVRFFALGAVTANTERKLLRVNIIHPGKETMVDRMEKALTFSHSPLTVAFIYASETLDYKGGGTSDGKIGKATDDDYGLVGPFTRWRVDIKADHNPGLDLSNVSSAYLEFECQFRAI